VAPLPANAPVAASSGNPINSEAKMTSFLKMAALAGALCFTAGLAQAQQSPIPVTSNVTSAGAYVGFSQGTAQCPATSWHIVPVANKLFGYMWNSDGSGISRVQGTTNPDHSFSMKLTSINGKGPTGTITGHRTPNGRIESQLTGTSCSYATPMVMIDMEGHGG